MAAVLDVTSDFVATSDLDGRILSLNPAGRALLGIDLDEDLSDVRMRDLAPEWARRKAVDEIMPALVLEGIWSGESALLARDGREIPISQVAMAHVAADGRPEFLSTIGRDIGDRKQAEADLRLRGAILDAVAYAAGRFLTVPSWREAIDDVLARLGEAARVSRVYLFQNHRGQAGELLTSQRAEWSSPGVAPQLAEAFLQDVPFDRDPFRRRRLVLESGHACVEHATELPEEDRAWFERQGNRSVMLMPIFAGKEWWGHIGFDECFADRVWTDAEIDALKAAAGTLGAAIQNERSQVEVRGREAVLAAVAFAAERFLAEPTWEEATPDVLARLGEAAGVSRVYVFRNGRDPQGRLTMTQLFEWVAPGVQPQITNPALQDEPWEGALGRWVEVLEAGDSIHSHVRLMTDEERRLLEPQAIRSIAVVPLFAGSEWWGVMGFDQCDREREWSVSEIDTLKAAAGILGATIDRQGTQRVVQQAEENYRQLVEQIPVVTYMDALDELGSTVYISPQLEAMLGYTPEEWIAELGIWVRVLYPEDRRRVLAEHQRVQATGERLDIEYRVIRRDGRPVWVRDESVLVRDASGRPLFRQGVVVDIDGRKLAEEHLREAETRYRNLVERLPAVTYVVSAPGVPLGQSIAYVSPQIEELLGCTRQEWLETETSWRKFVHPDDLDRIVAAWNAIAARGEPYSAEYRVVHRDGSVRWVRDEAVLMRDELGRPMFWQGIMIDATERKRAEDTLRTALEREREVAQGLRALDEMKNTFLAAVSHELRTPLSAILGFALTLDREDVEIPPAEARELLRRLAANARKLDRLLSDLLDLDRLSRGIVEPRRRLTDISALVRQVVDDADMVEHHPIRVHAEPVTISVDPAKVERILENLIVNAGRYTPPGTTILVSVTAQGGGVLIAVDDEGPGVSEDLREAIFEPFRQGPARLTHSPGVGVGLTLVARFAELHGGRAWMEPRGGGGSSFRVFLPSPLPEPGRERG